MERPMSRRDLLVGSAGTVVVAGLSAPSAMAAEPPAGHAVAHEALVVAANGCVSTGETCLAHCLSMFAAGDTSLAACARSVAEMMPVCQAVARLATLGSARLGQFLAPCIDLCTDCERECRKHADTHAVCKACADACAKFIAEAKTVQAA